MIWHRQGLDAVTDKFTQTINPRGAGLYRVRPQN
jgi:hypothetical protein